MPRVRSWNAFETALNGAIDNSVTTITLVSVDNLPVNCFLVIDPDVQASREYVYVQSVDGSGKTVTIRVRPEQGSTGGVSHAHSDGAIVRAVPVHQWLDEIFDDFDALALSFTNHVPGTDPHPQYLSAAVGDATYLKLTGGTLTAPLTLPAANPTLANQATRKGYVDAQDTAAIASAASAAAGLYIPLGGGTMTGALLLNTNTPTQDLQATSRKYVDDAIAAATGGGGSVFLRLDGSNNLSGTNSWLQKGVADTLYLPQGATAAAASKWATARTITVSFAGSPDITGSGQVSIDGSANATITIANAAVVNDSHTHGTQYYTKAQVDQLLAALIIPASRVSAGTFPAGTFTIQGGLGVTGAVSMNGTVDMPGIPAGGGTHDLRWASGTGALSRL